MEGKKRKVIIREVLLSIIDRPDDMVRMEISESGIQELADSIREVGLLEPILVHPKGEGFGIIAGDRRYLAHEKLGLEKIMCIIKDIEPEEVMWLRATENVQREDLTPLEEGHIYGWLHCERDVSIEKIAKRMGKSPGVIKRRMDILRMPESFQRALHGGQVSIAVAEELWSCPDAAKREYFIEMAVEHGIKKGVARMWVQDYKKSLRGSPAAGGEGGGGPLAYEDVPIYRACDICKGPVDYSKLKELRTCESCFGSIVEVLHKDS